MISWFLPMNWDERPTDRSSYQLDYVPIIAILSSQVRQFGQVFHQFLLATRHRTYQKAAPAETLAFQAHTAQHREPLLKEFRLVPFLLDHHRFEQQVGLSAHLA